MDVYGAFQMCAIGTLVVPLMIKLSRSHEYSTYIGRRIMFMWAGLVLTGMHDFDAYRLPDDNQRLTLVPSHLRTCLSSC